MTAPLAVDRDRLTQPFPSTAIRQREAVRGGKKLDYVEGHTVIHRLNSCCPSWDFAVKDLDTSVIGRDRDGNDILLVRAHVALTLPGMGTREHIGVQAVRANAGEDLVKGAVTDALKKAATLFGVGLELYGPDYEAGEIEVAHRRAPVDFAQTRGRILAAAEDDYDPGPPDFPPAVPQARSAPPVTGNGGGQAGGNPITPRQLKFIQAIAREKGLGEEQLHAELSRAFPERASLTQLTTRDASAFIDRLQARRPE